MARTLRKLGKTVLACVILLAVIFVAVGPVDVVAANENGDYAGGKVDVVIDDSKDIETRIGGILGVLLGLCTMVGGGAFIYALITFGLSIAQENPEQRARAIVFLIAGLILMLLRSVLRLIGLIS